MAQRLSEAQIMEHRRHRQADIANEEKEYFCALHQQNESMIEKLQRKVVDWELKYHEQDSGWRQRLHDANAKLLGTKNLNVFNYIRSRVISKIFIDHWFVCR